MYSILCSQQLSSNVGFFGLAIVRRGLDMYGNSSSRPGSKCSYSSLYVGVESTAMLITRHVIQFYHHFLP